MYVIPISNECDCGLLLEINENTKVIIMEIKHKEESEFIICGLCDECFIKSKIPKTQSKHTTVEKKILGEINGLIGIENNNIILE